MKSNTTQAAKRKAPDGFWLTAKGRRIIADREAAREREVWQRFEAWG